MLTNPTTTDRRAFIISSVLAGIAALAGCRGGELDAPRHLFIGLDTSGSAREQIGGFLSCAVMLAEELNPGSDFLTVYRVGHEIREFTGGHFDGDIEKLARTLKAETEPVKEMRGTLPAAFWTAVSDRVRNESGTAITVVFFSDGFNDDASGESWKMMRKAAAVLAASRDVRSVAICGAHAETWARLRDTFAPLGDRFHLLSPTQCVPGAVADLLNAPA